MDSGLSVVQLNPGVSLAKRVVDRGKPNVNSDFRKGRADHEKSQPGK